MERLWIEGTKSTPTVDFDAEQMRLTIRGESYPENAFKFYEPIIHWLDGFLQQMDTNRRIEMNVRLPYVNTSSSKCVMMILERLEQAKSQGKHTAVNWYYDTDNESELECAEEFQEFVELDEFNLIPSGSKPTGE